MRSSRIIAAFCFVFSQQSAASYAFTASELNKACLAKGENAAELTCTSYLRGFLDGISSGQAIQKRKANEFCPPKGGIETTQGRLIIEKYYQEHPEALGDEAGLPAMVAILFAFPCKPSTR